MLIASVGVSLAICLGLFTRLLVLTGEQRGLNINLLRQLWKPVIRVVGSKFARP